MWLIAFHFSAVLACDQGLCPPEFVSTRQVGNSACDSECMTESCGFDGGVSGDCLVTCQSTGCSAAVLADGNCDTTCDRWECGWDFGDCGNCASGCTTALLNNAQCDSSCNTPECEYDNGLCVSESNPAVVFITSTSNGSNLGSKRNPKWSLSEALMGISYSWSTVYLLRGTHYLKPTSNGTLHPLLSKTQNIKITTLFCSQESHPECALEPATIKLGDHKVGLDSTTQLTLSDLVFDGELTVRPGCDQCLYCPYTASSGTNLVNDRGEVIDPSTVAPQSWCTPFNTLKFIEIVRGTLTAQRVTFKNFRQQYSALIASTEGKLSLSDVIFTNIQVDMTGTNSAVISQSACALFPYGCGSFQYTGGSVSLLNNGYEDMSSLALSGFVVGYGFNSVVISGVTFSYNFVQVGSAASKARSSLLYFNNLRSLQVLKCVFEYTIAKSAIVHIDSGFQIPQVVSNGLLVDHELYHIQIINSVFRANTVGMGVAAMTYGQDMQNIMFSNTTFNANVALTDSVLVFNGPPLTTELLSGVFKNITIGGVVKSVFFPPRNLTFTNCTIADNDCISGSVLKVNIMPNIYMDNLLTAGNGNYPSTTTWQSFTFSAFVSSPLSYISKLPVSSAVLNRQYILNFQNCGSLNLTYSTFRNNTSNNAAGLVSGMNNVSMHDVVMSGNLGLGSLAGAFTILSAASVIELYNLQVTSNRAISGRAALGLYSRAVKSTYIVRDCVFSGNQAQRTGGLLSADSDALIVKNVTFVRNSVAQSAAAMGFRAKATATFASVQISDSIFQENSAGLYGTLHVENTVSGLITISLKIASTRYTANTADQGSALFIGPEVWLSSDSSVSNCNFTDNRSLRDGTVYLAQSMGTMSFESCRFSGNAANQGSAVYVAVTSQTALVQVTNCRFQYHVGINGVLTIPSTTQMPLLKTTSNLFLDNASQGVKVTTGVWYDTSSVFQNNTAVQGGAVALSSQAAATLTGTQFLNNSASNYGGAISIFDSSTLTCTGCTASGNTCGMKGAVVYSFNNSTLSFFGGRIQENRSRGQGSAFYISGSIRTVFVRDTELIGNIADSFGLIVLYEAGIEIRNSTSRDNLAGELTSGIHSVMSNVSLFAVSVFNASGYYGGFIYASQFSIVTINSSSFGNIIAFTEGGIASISQSVLLTMENSTFDGVSAASGGIVSSDKDSEVRIVKSSFICCNSSDSLLEMDSGYLIISNSRFQDITGAVVNSINAEIDIKESAFSTISSTIGVVHCEKCRRVSIESSAFIRSTDAEKGASVSLLSAKQSSISLSSVAFINNSAVEGGALYISGGVATIDNCDFIGNRANTRGGAVSLDCPSASLDCCFEVRSSRFRENAAGLDGGAVRWSAVQPLFDNLTLSGNAAEYGPDVASFPVKLSLDSTQSPNPQADLILSSGQIYTKSIRVLLIDHYGQVVVTSNSSVQELQALDPVAVKVTGATRQQVLKGVATFTNFRVSAQPGTEVQVLVVSDLVAETLVIPAIMRVCEVGEFEHSNECELCSFGYYSLRPSMPCTRCPDTAECYGGFSLVPKAGHWRSSNSTDTLFACPNEDACIGSPDNSSMSLTGHCATGYFGNKCDGCLKEYYRSTAHKCSKCPNQTVNAVVFVLLLVLVIAIAVVMIWTALRSANRPKSVLSIYIKIFMNYLQLVLACTSANLNYPASLIKFSEAQGKVGNFGDQLFSIDCFFTYPDSVDSIERKLQLLTVGPVMMILGAVGFWVAVKVIRQRQQFVFAKAVASVIVLIFLMHPTLTRVMLSQFHCTTIDPGEQWLANNLNIRCWKGTHQRLALTIALPSIIVWVIGLPAMSLLYLLKHKTQLESLRARVMFGFLINGYTLKRFYWEFVIIYRKVLVISVGVFMSNVSISVQAVSLMTVMVAAFTLQSRLKPYFTDRLNSLEQKGLLVSAVTIYCGLYFISPGITNTGEIFLFAMIVVSNAYFLLFWLTAVSGSTLLWILERFHCLRRWRTSKVASFVERIEGSYARSSVSQKVDESTSRDVSEVGPKVPAQSIDDSIP